MHRPAQFPELPPVMTATLLSSLLMASSPTPFTCGNNDSSGIAAVPDRYRLCVVVFAGVRSGRHHPLSCMRNWLS